MSARWPRGGGVGGRPAHAPARAAPRHLPPSPHFAHWRRTAPTALPPPPSHPGSYAAEFSRDVEPTVEGGSKVYLVAKSCLGLYKRGGSCSDAGAAAEPCCTRADKEVFANAWSLARADGSDYLVTAQAGERAALVAGGAWVERCSPIANPTAFCVDGGERDGSGGPFILYNRSGVAHPREDGSAFPTAPLYRCYAAGSGRHFLSRDSACEGGGSAESVLGWVALAPGWEMLRALRRCLAAAGQPSGPRLHSLDLPCQVADPAAPGILGYVR